MANAQRNRKKFLRRKIFVAMSQLSHRIGYTEWQSDLNALIDVQQGSLKVSDEFQWRQIGVVANTVLFQARKNAIRQGLISKADDGFVPRVERDRAEEFALAASVFSPSASVQAAPRACSRLPEQLAFPFSNDPGARYPAARRSASRRLI
jgi:hypothetical protein